MIDMKRALGAAGLVAALVMGSTRADAQATYTVGDGGLETVSWSLDNNSETGLAGAITLTYVSGNTSPGTFTTVCTDVGGTVYLGYNYTYSALTPFSPATIGLDPTWGLKTGNAQYNEAAGIQAAAEIFNAYVSVLTGTDTDAKAGLQLAVWAALYNSGHPPPPLRRLRPALV